MKRVVCILLLLFAAGLYVFTNTYESLVLLLACILLPLLSLGMMFLAGRNLQVEISADSYAEQDDVRIRCILTNRSRLPAAGIRIRLSLENQMTGERMEQEVRASAGGGKTIRSDLSVEGCLAGELQVRSERIRLGDTFGLFYRSLVSPPPCRILVYPRQKQVHVLTRQAAQTKGEGDRYDPHRPGQDVTELFAIRDYAAGDDLRSIHWKLSAKAGKPLTRQFSQPVQYTLTLLPELDGTDGKKLDQVLSLGFSLSEALLEEGLVHDLVWYDAAGEELIRQGLDDFSDLETAYGRILSRPAPREKKAGLQQYLDQNRESQDGTLLYVTADASAEEMLQQSGMDIVVVSATEKDEADERREIII